MDPVPLEEGWHLAAVAQERHRQCSRVQDIPNQPAHPVREASSGFSFQLVGGPPHAWKLRGGHNPSRVTQTGFGRVHCTPQD